MGFALEKPSDVGIAEVRDAVSVIVLISMWWRQRTIEDRVWLSFNIDERKLGVGEYLRRKEALYCVQARALLLIGISKFMSQYLSFFGSFFEAEA